MGDRRFRSAALLALLVLGSSFFPLALTQPAPELLPATPGVDAPPRLWLKCGVFDPVSTPPPLAPGLMLKESQGYLIVQFDGPVTAERRGWLDGVSEVLAYLPDYAYVVRDADASAMRTHPGVRYVGLFEPGYKIAPQLPFSRDTVELAVQCFVREDQPGVVEELQAMGAVMVRSDPLMVLARAPAALALAIAFIPEVQWVDGYHPPEFQNNAAAKIIRARAQNDGGYNWGTASLWSYNATSGSYEGYAGQNFSAALVDTGIDGSHPAFAGKKVAYYAYGYSDWTDYDGHGTHTAGTVLGNGAYRATDPGTAGRYAGMAPLAGLVGQLGANAGYYTWCHDAYVSGAVVQSNSWGGGYAGTYDFSASSYDACVRDSDFGTAGEQPLTVCFSAGNLGQYGAGSVVPPSTAKNVICVGATDDSNGQSIAYFSSRGPCDDGRIKPDLVAPGLYVTSCAGNSAYSYVQASGTSMSCPVVAGACVLVNEYYNKSMGELPSPAMVKARLINGAAPLPSQTYPGNAQGWGRVDVANSLLNTTNRRIWSEDQQMDLITGAARTYLVNVTKAAELRVTLVWTDFCGTANAAKALVNDLDLEITLPNGTLYKGNVFSNGYSAPNGTADSVNNVEGARFQSAQAGKWRIDVRARNLGWHAQDFALVIGGPFDNVMVARVDLAAQNLTLDPADPAEGDRVTLHADICNVGDLPVPGPRYRLSVRGEYNLTTVLGGSNFTSLLPGDSMPVQAEWTAVRGLTTFIAEADPLLAVPEDNETNNIGRLEVLVRGYGVGLSCAEPSITARPGATGNLSVTVHNLGNSPDNFTLAIEGEMPAGWNVTPATGLFPVPAGANLSVNVSATVATDALSGDRASFRLRATSNGNSTYTKRIELEAMAEQYYDFRLSGSATLVVPPGATATHSIFLDNAGNGPDAVELTMFGVPEGWGAFLSGGKFNLQAREKQRATLTVMPPAKAPALASSNITIEAASGEGKRQFIYLSTVVAQSAGVELSLAEWPDSAVAGDTTIFILKVENPGNGLDAVNLGVTGEEGWGFSFYEPAPEVRAWDFVLADLCVTVPRSAIAGEHSFKVRAVSTANSSASSELEATLYVDQYYSVELSAEYQNDTVETGNSTQFTVTVNNTGNGDDTFVLRVEGSGTRDWRTPVTPSTVPVARGASGSVLLKLRPPVDVPEGNYTFTLKAASSGDPTATAVMKFSVRMVAPPPVPPPPAPPAPPAPRPEPEPAPMRNRYVAWIEDHWMISILLLVAIIALAAGGTYAAMRRRRKKAPEGTDAGAPPEAAITMAPSAHATKPASPPADELAQEPAPSPLTPSPPGEPMETLDTGPPGVPAPEPAPAPARNEAPVPPMPVANRQSDGPSRTSRDGPEMRSFGQRQPPQRMAEPPIAKRAVEDDIDEILARLNDTAK